MFKSHILLLKRETEPAPSEKDFPGHSIDQSNRIKINMTEEDCPGTHSEKGEGRQGLRGGEALPP